MFPTIVKRGTSEVSFLTPAEANEALPDVPTDVFTNRFVQVDWARKTIGVVASGRWTGLPPTDEVICLNTLIMQLSCMTCRKIWVIFVGPMVLPRPAISYETIPDKLLRIGDYDVALSDSCSASLLLFSAAAAATGCSSWAQLWETSQPSSRSEDSRGGASILG